MDLSWVEFGKMRPLKRVEYERLVEMGAFQDDRLELLRGILVTMSPQGAAHADTTARLHELLLLALRGRAAVRAHSSFLTREDSVPEPDIAVVPPGDYSRQHPAQAFLLVEVSESSLQIDRKVKADLYAEAGVTEYWIVNLAGRVIEVHDQPSNATYARTRTFRPGETIVLAAFSDVAVAVAGVLPPPARTD